VEMRKCLSTKDTRNYPVIFTSIWFETKTLGILATSNFKHSLQIN